MRLLTVGSLPPEWGGPVRGGVATFHATLLEGLAVHDDVELVGVVLPSPLTKELPLPSFSRPDGVGTAAFYEDLLEQLDPDVVLMNHVAHTIGVTHARLAAPPPAVGVAHSWHNITFRSGEARNRARHVTEEALAGLTGLVCPSSHCIDEGERLGLRYPREAAAIHYPLQPLYLEEEGIDVGAESRDGVLYVGSLIERKNPVRLVEAASLLSGVQVTLVGKGDEAERLRTLIDGLDLAGRARIAHLPERDHLRSLRDLFLRSNVLCLPSDSESFGIVFIEALACGTPVVGFGPTVREIRDTMGIEIGEPLDRNTPEAIATAIETVIAADWDRSELRKSAVESFDLARTTDRYVELLGRVLPH